jgi:hypothetical protein
MIHRFACGGRIILRPEATYDLNFKASCTVAFDEDNRLFWLIGLKPARPLKILSIGTIDIC